MAPKPPKNQTSADLCTPATFVRRTKVPLLRFQVGMTQAELAKKVGCEDSILCRIERAQVRNTPAILRIREKIAGVFGLTVEEIFGPGTSGEDD